MLNNRVDTHINIKYINTSIQLNMSGESAVQSRDSCRNILHAMVEDRRLVQQTRLDARPVSDTDEASGS